MRGTIGGLLAFALSAIGCSGRDDHPPPVDSVAGTGARAHSANEQSGGEGGGTDQPTSESEAPSTTGTLTVQNSAGRTGAYFLPAGYDESPRPVMLAFHPSNGSGAGMVQRFQVLAEARRFVIVAPDSRREDAWQVGDGPGDITPDFEHALDCLSEVEGMPGVQVDDDLSLVVGYSAGGSSAPYVATNQERWATFAVLHGGVIEGGLGNNVTRGWLSTGTDDSLRPPVQLQASADYLESLGFVDITFELYPGGHSLSDEEVSDVVAWWLGG